VRWRKASGGRVLACAGLAVVLVGGCGSGASPTPAPAGTSAAGLAVPGRVMTAGTLTWCTDVSYPPGESYAADGTTPEGFDVDIAAEIARRWGVTNKVQATGWDALLPTLRGNGCDLVISTMSSAFQDRAKQADFVDYLKPWTALVVAAGNPKGIQTLENLAGKTIAVEPGVAPEADVRAASAELVAAGKPAIKIITTTQSDEKWIEDLVNGKVDALAGDSVHAAYHAALPPYAGKAEVGGPAINPQPIGIAIRKDDAGMKEAVAGAIDAIYADGTMKAIVEKWGIADAVTLLR
jgi:polar amino acid transport system substrate-binding protein